MDRRVNTEKLNCAQKTQRSPPFGAFICNLDAKDAMALHNLMALGWWQLEICRIKKIVNSRRCAVEEARVA